MHSAVVRTGSASYTLLRNVVKMLHHSSRDVTVKLQLLPWAKHVAPAEHLRATPGNADGGDHRRRGEALQEHDRCVSKRSGVQRGVAFTLLRCECCRHPRSQHNGVMMGPENGLPASIASIAVIVHTHSMQHRRDVRIGRAGPAGEHSQRASETPMRARSSPLLASHCTRRACEREGTTH
jgi:hypothetical protein